MKSKIITIIIIVKKKHENVFKNWLCPNFLLLPKRMGVCENLRLRGGGLLGLYAPLNETKKDKLFFKQLRSSYLLG